MIGFQAQPQLLSTSFGVPSTLSILLPSLDTLSLDGQVPVPASVRPITFFVQGIDIRAFTGIRALDGSVVIAD